MLSQQNPSVLETKSENDNSSNELCKPPEIVQKDLLLSNGKLLDDENIARLKKLVGLKTDIAYFHRKKEGLSGDDRIDSPYSIAIGNNGDLYAIYRDTKNNKSIRLGEEGLTANGVKLAQNLSTQEWVVTKTLVPSFKKSCEEFKKFATNEVEILGALGHAKSKVIERRRRKKNEEGLLLPKYQFFMDIAKGTDLYDLISQGKLPKDAKALLTIGRNFIQELKKLHDLRYIHLDVKIENIFVDINTGEVTLIDYGFGGKLNKDNIIPSDRLRGTLEILAPELLKPYLEKTRCYAYSIATDLYAASLVLFVLLFGRRRVFDEYNKAFCWFGDKKILRQKDQYLMYAIEGHVEEYRIHSDIWKILEKMMGSPHTRPSLKEVSEVFEKHLALLTDSVDCEPLRASRP